MKTYKINIATPCKEDWAKMTQTEKGKHCTLCNKVVIDFSNLKNEDIIQYLLSNKNTCGRFYTNQLHKSILLQKYTIKSNWHAIAAMLIAGLFSVLPNTLLANTQPKKNIPILNVATNIENNTKKTELAKIINYSFRISISFQLLNFKDSSVVYNGHVYIEEIGSFIADKNGIIVIEINEINIPEIINITISATGYEHLIYKLYKKDIKGGNITKLYLKEKEMVLGIISID